jgi:hypothetical protein
LSRLFISLLINGIPRKIQTDNIVEVFEPNKVVVYSLVLFVLFTFNINSSKTKGSKSARRMLINPNNAMARWDYWQPIIPKTKPCNRTTVSKQLIELSATKPLNS